MKKDSKESAKMEEGKPQIIQINEGEVQAHVDRLVKQTVEEMLNGMLDTCQCPACTIISARRKGRRNKHFHSPSLLLPCFVHQARCFFLRLTF